MKHKMINKSVKLNNEEIFYLSVLKDKYKVNQSSFIRLAIIEKLKRDVPELRKEFQKQTNCPF